jgi:hypothetical protein
MVIVGLLVFAAVLTVANSRKGGGNLGTDLYVVGKAKSLAGTVSRDGPLLLQDLLGNSRDIYVQHLAGDDWRSFEAHAPGAPRRCVLHWNPGARTFTDPCNSAVAYPADGAGLVAFPTSVDRDGRLIVDLRTPVQPTPTTTTTTTSSPAPASP